MPSRAYLEHVAVRVRDIDWHIRFFEAVFGWTVRQSEDFGGSMHKLLVDNPRQVWIGGIQLMADPAFDGTEGRAHHLGVRCESVDGAMDTGYTFSGVTPHDRGRNWLVLPEGMIVELLPTSEAAVTTALRVHPEL